MSSQIDQLIDLANAISRGDVPPYQHYECFTAGAFDLLLVNAKDAEAFELLTELCQRFQSVDSSGNGVNGYYDLLTQLARQSNTSEMPTGMVAVINKHPDLASDLRLWYRWPS